MLLWAVWGLKEREDLLNYRPRVHLDHVLVAVPELTEGAREFEMEYGLQALRGGKHPEAGTANMIVPFGSSYIELISIVDVDKARRSPSGMRIAQAIAEKRRFPNWVVRTNDLSALREYLRATGLELPEPTSGARVLPDGVTLKWNSQFLTISGVPTVLPSVTEWLVPPGRHPAKMEVDHPSKPLGIRLVHLGDPNPSVASNQLRSVLGDGVAYVIDKASISGVQAVEIETRDKRIVIR